MGKGGGGGGGTWFSSASVRLLSSSLLAAGQPQTNLDNGKEINENNSSNKLSEKN